MNATHDPQRRSWVPSANRPGGAFPIQNLPLGVFDGAKGPTIGAAIGDQVLDLRGCQALLGGLPAGTVEACAASTLNPLMALGPESLVGSARPAQRSAACRPSSGCRSSAGPGASSHSYGGSDDAEAGSDR